MTIQFIESRIDAVGELPICLGGVASHLWHTAVGVAATALSVLTLGKNEKINELADQTSRSGYILGDIYQGVLNLVNGESDLDHSLQ